jgi:hypothetical protein
MQTRKVISGLFGLFNQGCSIADLILYSLLDIIKRRLPNDGRSLSLIRLGRGDDKSVGSTEHDGGDRKDETRHDSRFDFVLNNQ